MDKPRKVKVRKEIGNSRSFELGYNQAYSDYEAYEKAKYKPIWDVWEKYKKQKGFSNYILWANKLFEAVRQVCKEKK